MIPILAAILHYNLINDNYNYKISYLIIFVVLFATIKFHYRFNIDKKFHDLEGVDKSKSINANHIHENLENLKWISRFENPEIEINVLKSC